MTGFVYLFAADYGFYKIGQSIDPEQRLKQFDTLPFNVRLVHTFSTNDMTYAERHFHAKFRHRRVKGEWFKLEQNDIAEIISVKSFNNNDCAEKDSNVIEVHLSTAEAAFYYCEATKSCTAVEEWIKAKCGYKRTEPSERWVCECKTVNLTGTICGRCGSPKTPDIAF